MSLSVQGVTYYESQIALQEELNKRDNSECQLAILRLNNEKERDILLLKEKIERKKVALELKKERELRAITSRFQSKENKLKKKEEYRKKKRDFIISMYRQDIEGRERS
jgi:hypothetical protein